MKEERQNNNVNQKQNRPAVALTDSMIEHAEALNKDKLKAIDFLQKAGILDSKGKTRPEYTA